MPDRYCSPADLRLPMGEVLGAAILTCLFSFILGSEIANEFLFDTH